MGQITAAQLYTMSEQFSDIANAILNYRMNNVATIGNNDAQLEQLQNELLDDSNQLATLSAIAAGDDAATAITNLSNVSKQIVDTINGLADVQKAIDITTAAVGVVSAVVTGNIGGIASAVGALGTSCGIKI